MAQVLEMTANREYEPHPFSEVWQLMDDEEFKTFKASMQSQGQLLPIILYQGKILDGRNRYNAGKELGMRLHYETSTAKNDGEAIDLVLALNKERKHRSLEERGFAGARLATLREGRPSKTVSTETVKKSRADVAKKVGVSLSTLSRAKGVLEHDKKHGTNLERQVTSKKKSLTTAYNETSKKPRRAPTKSTSAMAVHAQRNKPARVLTRQDVDPDFVGTDLEFAQRYGHVWSRTAVEMASDAFRALSLELGRVSGDLQQVLKGTTLDLSKLRTKPKDKDITRLREAFVFLEAVYLTARDALVAAEAL